MGLIQRQLIHKSCWAAAFPEILRRIKLNIGMDVFVRTSKEYFIHIFSLFFSQNLWEGCSPTGEPHLEVN